MLNSAFFLLHFIAYFAPESGVWFETTGHNYYVLIKGANVVYYPTKNKKGRQTISDTPCQIDKIEKFENEPFLNGVYNTRQTVWQIIEDSEMQKTAEEMNNEALYFEIMFQLKQISPWRGLGNTFKFRKIQDPDPKLIAALHAQNFEEIRESDRFNQQCISDEAFRYFLNERSQASTRMMVNRREVAGIPKATSPLSRVGPPPGSPPPPPSGLPRSPPQISDASSSYSSSQYTFRASDARSSTDGPLFRISSSQSQTSGASSSHATSSQLTFRGPPGLPPLRRNGNVWPSNFETSSSQGSTNFDSARLTSLTNRSSGEVSNRTPTPPETPKPKLPPSRSSDLDTSTNQTPTPPKAKEAPPQPPASSSTASRSSNKMPSPPQAKPAPTQPPASSSSESRPPASSSTESKPSNRTPSPPKAKSAPPKLPACRSLGELSNRTPTPPESPRAKPAPPKPPTSSDM